MEDNIIMTNRGSLYYDGTNLNSIDATSTSYKRTCPMFSYHLFGCADAYGGGGLGSIIIGNGELLIEADITNNIESNHAYGIANSNMTLGDVSTGQLLWSNIT